MSGEPAHLARLVALFTTAAIITWGLARAVASSHQVITISQPMVHADALTIAIDEVTYQTASGNVPMLGQTVRMTTWENCVRAIGLAQQPDGNWNVAQGESLEIEVTPPAGFGPMGERLRPDWDWDRDTVGILAVRIVLGQALRKLARDSLRSDNWMQLIDQATRRGDLARAARIRELGPSSDGGGRS